MKTNPTSEHHTPTASDFVKAPLRNRIRVELKARVPQVWALVGDLARFPEYSLGLARVDATTDPAGSCKGYVCYFKPREEGGEGVVHGETMRWFERDHGWASTPSEKENAFGLTESLSLVTLEPSTEGTLLTWDQYYDGHDLGMLKAEFDQALADIVENLVRRFGGRALVRYVEAGRRGR